MRQSPSGQSGETLPCGEQFPQTQHAIRIILRFPAYRVAILPSKYDHMATRKVLLRVDALLAQYAGSE